MTLFFSRSSTVDTPRSAVAVLAVSEEAQAACEHGVLALFDNEQNAEIAMTIERPEGSPGEDFVIETLDIKTLQY